MFSVGQVVHHKLFNYRGVIIDADPIFQGSEEWYEQIARSRPPKDEPWYHVLVHQTQQETYVAERNLEPDEKEEAIEHPLIDTCFSGFQHGRYTIRNRLI